MTKLYAGLDVSLEMTRVCVVDEDGRICLEAKVASEPTALVETLRALDGGFVRVGLEAGPLSQWLFFGLTDAGLPAVCIETRHLKGAIGAMAANKTDRNDARAIAQGVRSGWFKAVHVKSTESQELRVLLSAREFLVNKVRDHENEIRGLLRPFGLKVGRVGAAGFEARARELVAERPVLVLCMEALLTAREVLRRELNRLHLAATGGEERRALPALHDDPGRRPGDRARLQDHHRPSRAVPALCRCWRASRAHTAAAPVRRDRPAGADHPMRRYFYANGALRGRQRDAQPDDAVDRAEGVGRPACGA